jgi:hypothetical protein
MIKTYWFTNGIKTIGIESENRKYAETVAKRKLKCKKVKAAGFKVEGAINNDKSE